MNQNKKVIFLEILFFLVFPFLIWKLATTFIKPYHAMLISSIPTLLYALYCLKKQKKFNVTSLYILINLILGTILDFLSGSAEQMIWNNAYYQILLGSFTIGTIFFKKPLVLYFAADIAVLQGYNREVSCALFRDKRIYPALQYLTLLSGFQIIAKSCLKLYFISFFWVDSYGEMRAIMTVIDWGLNICIVVGGFIWITHKVNYVTRQNSSSQ